jgi:glutathione peroxidase
MIKLSLVAAGFILLLWGAPLGAGEKVANKVPAVLKFKMAGIDGKDVDLAKYRGKVILFVNVASECGYTPQYKGLQALYAKYAKDGLVVLGFPCNDFGNQEPGDNAAIKEFCSKNYKVEFDMFAKIAILGNDPAPLYKYLTSKETNPKSPGAVRWNFEKFLIGRDGAIVARFLSDVDPESDQVQKAIQAELAKK